MGDTFSGVDDGLGVPVDETYESVFEPDPAPVKANDPDIGKGSTEGSAESSPEEVQERRMQIIKALLKAKASPNTLDGLDRTPLDLAVSEGGPGAEDLPIVKKMMDLGCTATLQSPSPKGAIQVAEDEEADLDFVTPV